MTYIIILLAISSICAAVVVQKFPVEKQELGPRLSPEASYCMYLPTTRNLLHVLAVWHTAVVDQYNRRSEWPVLLDF